ncbi:MAG: flippase-like domain-containing protein [Myxococcales bacterium]|nr:flippase-like domain-containing protein [Myxococcales bacterium]MDH5305712.1 flippase-like domain-containing protein [Myxococcales bacterium]MDH5565099.1 flippase-like domain-containing protein [Myxococcales bacterium]
MKLPLYKILRGLLPWIISGCLLAYVFGWATDWQRLRQATEQANLPLFVLFVTADRLAFFVIWTWLWAAALRRLVANVPLRSVFAIRGGSELARVVSSPVSDAAFFLGLVQLAGGRIEAVAAAALVPAIAHFAVMLVQMTIAAPFLEGGVAANPGLASALAVLWTLLIACAIAVWLFRTERLKFRAAARVAAWIDRFPPRELAIFFWGFAALALFDVQIQWLASHAFGVPIDWTALAARIPIVYLLFTIPTLGNFGTRELAWAGLFAEFGARDALIAYAFAVNALFMVLNLAIGIVFLPRAVELIAALRRARREGERVPRPLLHDPTDH